jgi:hypothetical protein
MAVATLVMAVAVSACTSADDPPASMLSPSSTASVPVPSPNPSADPATRTSTIATDVPGFSPVTTRSLQAMLNGLPGSVGVAIGPVGTSQPAQFFGDLDIDVAWSSIKVPLALAAQRADPEGSEADIVLAITNSDNAAAQRLWESLGTPVEAAAAVQDVLAEAGDTTTQVQSQQVRPGFTAFGQTQWSLLAQAEFAAAFPCLPDSTDILALMRKVSATQQWGVQMIEDTAVKGGWGPEPDPEGNYLVRQLAVVPVGDAQVAITMATTSDGGTFEDGTAILDSVGAWVSANLDELPAGTCG